MKKIFWILALILVFCFTGCGKDSGAKEIYHNANDNSFDTETGAGVTYAPVQNEENDETNIETSTMPEETVEETVQLDSSSTNVYDPSVGPIITELSWNENKRKYTCVLNQYNINTGTKEELWQYTYQNMGNVHPIIDPSRLLAQMIGNAGERYGISWKYGNIFSPDLSKMAVRFYDSGAEHVGYMDKNGDVTDITEIVHPYTNDFTSKAPKDDWAFFTSDGEFAFWDKNNNSTVYVDLSTNQIVKETERDDYTRLFYSNGEMIDPSFIERRDYLIYCFGADNNEVILCDTKSLKLYNKDTGEEITITPETDFYIDDCAYYDGQVAFIAYRNNGGILYEGALFLMNDFSGNGTVEKICDLPVFSDNDYPNIHTYGTIFWK